ncbi:MAG TPA: hypothetical protein VLH10_16640 [Yinghuangia sp.]|uniref:hypothetical protein n=1 Tax=Yinghuangia sp. YIM S10712 TaxID=3436930 RepID=UPI002CAF484D|nr:hypothetical protein [Yinghuangia sp.]
MTDTERWTTPADLAAARAAFEAAIPGWRTPAAFALGIAARETRPEGPAVVFPVVNAGGGALSAVVLATVCGHRAGTATYRLTLDQLDAAIRLLAPAEACADVPHGNLTAWRAVRDDLAALGESAAHPVAVFVADLADPPADAHDRVLRDRIPPAAP